MSIHRHSGFTVGFGWQPSYNGSFLTFSLGLWWIDIALPFGAKKYPWDVDN